MHITQIQTRTALVKSKIEGVDYVINPYLGCAHGCKYCYAKFMAKWSRHHAGHRWGTFVEVKINLPQVLRSELRSKRKRSAATLSSVCDPYQPIEACFEITRKSIMLLKEFGWNIDILTRSPLVIRDIDLLRSYSQVTVGISIPTDDDRVRKVLEPNSPPIESRFKTLMALANAGVRTWVFIAPMLPMDPLKLYEVIAPYAGYVMIDRLNYPEQVEAIFRRHKWHHALSKEYEEATESTLLQLFGKNVRCV